jgi:type IV pilus assembly protein PilY1
LTAQSITYELSTNTVQGGVNNNRVISNNTVCYKGDTTTTGCTTNNSYGWYMDLVSPTQGQQGEKVIYNPVLRSGVLIVTTTIPSVSSGLSCQAASNSGWTMALDPATGGRLTFEPFDTTGNGQFDQVTVGGSTVNSSGISLGAVGSPSFVTYDNTTYIVTNTFGGTPTLSRSNLGTGNVAVQLSWQELR